MDRCPNKKDGRKITKLKMAIALSGVLIISLWCDIVYAGMQKEKDSKIELEKEEIFGILERPNVIFPIRWKETEGPEERPYKLQRSFKEEIFDLRDMESIGKIKKQ